MIKSVFMCDGCGKELTDTGYKFIQPVALINFPPNKAKRVDVKGTEFCSTNCMLNAFTQALTEIDPI